MPSELPIWIQHEVLGIALWQYVAAFVLVLLGLVGKKVCDHLLGKKLVALLKRSRFTLDHMVTNAAVKPLGYLILWAGLAGACQVLLFPNQFAGVRSATVAALKILLAADVIWFLLRSVDVGVYYLAGLAEQTESTLDDQLVPLIRKALKVTIVLVCSLWAVQLLGYSVSSLLAGLGIGGLAVALALQDTLSNFFGSVFIFLDRPFKLGDWVKMGDVEGIVEEIGFRSTRVRTFPKTLVSIPNKTVANATIDNYSKMPKRRVLQTIGVTYETTADQMEQAVSAVREILEQAEDVDQEFIVVRFTEFGGSSLDITVLYFTTGVSFIEHTETKERVNLATMRALEKLGLSIAFPTQTVYFEGDVAKRLAGHSNTSGISQSRNENG